MKTAKYVISFFALGLFISLTVIFFNLFKSNDVYKFSVNKAKSNPVVLQSLGPEISEGLMPTGSISEGHQSGKTSLVITLKGSEGEGKLLVDAVKEDGVWHYKKLVFQDGKSKQSTDLLDRLPAQAH